MAFVTWLSLLAVLASCYLNCLPYLLLVLFFLSVRPALYDKDGVGEVPITHSCSPGIIPPFYSSFLFPVMPDLNILPEIIIQAFSLAFVSSSLLIFLGKKIANFHNYNVNSNQVRGQVFLFITSSDPSVFVLQPEPPANRKTGFFCNQRITWTIV